jgi:hypothetical protein
VADLNRSAVKMRAVEHLTSSMITAPFEYRAERVSGIRARQAEGRRDEE